MIKKTTSRKRKPNSKLIPKLEHIAVIGKFDDGKYRQILIRPGTQEVVLSAIVVCEGRISVNETEIEGISFEINQLKNINP